MKFDVLAVFADSAHRELDVLLKASLNRWLADNPDKEVKEFFVTADHGGNVFGKAYVTILYSEAKPEVKAPEATTAVALVATEVQAEPKKEE